VFRVNPGLNRWTICPNQGQERQIPQKKKGQKKKANGTCGRWKNARVERSGTLYYPCIFT